MLHSAADVVALLVGRGEVRYAISQWEAREDDLYELPHWYEATLDFEVLKGTLGAFPRDFVPIVLCRQRVL